MSRALAGETSTTIAATAASRHSCRGPLPAAASASPTMTTAVQASDA